MNEDDPEAGPSSRRSKWAWFQEILQSSLVQSPWVALWLLAIFLKIIILILSVALIYKGAKYMWGGIAVSGAAPFIFVALMVVLAILFLLQGLCGFYGIWNEAIQFLGMVVGFNLMYLIFEFVCYHHNPFSNVPHVLAADMVETAWVMESMKEGEMDEIQEIYKCCGKNGPRDYLKELKRKLLPASCYNNSKPGIEWPIKRDDNDAEVYMDGCLERCSAYFRQFLGPVFFGSLDEMITIFFLILIYIVLMIIFHFSHQYNEQKRQEAMNKIYGDHPETSHHH